MLITGIIQENCIQCGQCIPECPSGLYSQSSKDDSKLVQFDDPLESCILCGHCIAVCPTNAIAYDHSDRARELPANWQQEKPSFESLKVFLRHKRTIRQYSPKPLLQADIQEILDVIRYSPSASNGRSWEFIVITDPEKIAELSKQIVKTIKFTRILMGNPIFKNLFLFGETRKKVKHPGFLPSINAKIEASERGEDPIFYNAPCIILLHAPSYGNLAGVDSGIALTYGMLAAETKGLGTCWIGVAQEALQRLPGLRTKFGLKRSQVPWGCFVMGIPSVSYKRLPPRDPLDVTWL